MRDLVERAPRHCGVPRSRWRLLAITKARYFLAGYCEAGSSKALRRLRVRLKRGQLVVHRPDPAYRQKFCQLERALWEAIAHPDQVRLLFGDEASRYRQPSLSQRWSVAGQPVQARLVAGRDHCWRLAGALDAVSGQVSWLARSNMRVPSLRAFLRLLRQRYPDRNQRLVLVWDTWSVHANPEVLAEAERQGIAILWLPTYAPWLNPIEQLWRQVRQTLVHHHRQAEQWEELKHQVRTLLDQYATGSAEVLRYVGLDPTPPTATPRHRRKARVA